MILYLACTSRHGVGHDDPMILLESYSTLFENSEESRRSSSLASAKELNGPKR